MAAFEKLDWQRIDVWAIAVYGGLVTVTPQERETYRTWLLSNGYTLDTIDCARPVNEIVADFHRLLDWEKHLSYELDLSSRNIDALREAFSFGMPEGGSQVLELVGVDVAWQQEPDWVKGLLFIIRERSRWQMALGHRFFGLLVIPEQSEMLGTMIEEISVPDPYE